MTDAEWMARRIMSRIEDDKAVHLSSLVEELAMPRPFYSINEDAVVFRRYEIASVRVPDVQESKIDRVHEVSINPNHYE